METTYEQQLYAVKIENVKGKIGAVHIVEERGCIKSGQDYLSVQKEQNPILMISGRERRNIVSKLERFRVQGKEIPRNKMFIITIPGALK